MRYLVAPDSYKGTLSAKRAALLIAEAIRSADPSAEIDACPLSDGGEGLLEVVHMHAGGRIVPSYVVTAAGRPILAPWLALRASGTALIESALSIGLSFLPTNERQAESTSSEGLGMVLLNAVQRGFRRIVVGLGGSATNDCGFGLARALGYELEYTMRGEQRDMIASLRSVSALRIQQGIPDMPPIEMTVLTDVTNPLLGPDGATFTYAKQKGVPVETLPKFEESIRHFAEILRRDVTDADPTGEGMGAAGGLGYALSTLFGAKVTSGIRYVLDIAGFEDRCARADVVITGEGKLDAQTRYGKVIHGVAASAARLGRPVIAVVGSIDGDPGEFLAGFPLKHIQSMTIRPSESDLNAVAAESNLRRAVLEALQAMNSF